MFPFKTQMILAQVYCHVCVLLDIICRHILHLRTPIAYNVPQAHLPLPVRVIPVNSAKLANISQHWEQVMIKIIVCPVPLSRHRKLELSSTQIVNVMQDMRESAVHVMHVLLTRQK